MSSCEYTLSRSNDRNLHNIIVRVHDIQFFKHDIELLPTSHLLRLSDYISVTLRLSKHDEVEEKIILHKTNDP